MPPSPGFRFVELHNLHCHIEPPRAREPFGEVLRTRPPCYASDDPPGYVFFDAPGSLGTYLRCCRERDGVSEGLGGDLRSAEVRR